MYHRKWTYFYKIYANYSSFDWKALTLTKQNRKYFLNHYLRFNWKHLFALTSICDFDKCTQPRQKKIKTQIFTTPTLCMTNRGQFIPNNPHIFKSISDATPLQFSSAIILYSITPKLHNVHNLWHTSANASIK